ncbi:hypothetical protein GCM10027413_28190 [Conyzicola nivalis]|uniref:Uncharacterized protein n=1 Tax=Conyzicola nivalis TaxID=1477021 RepID=A0A916SSF7_9MICO|nr:hypothetical protein [Conyzicola nivalis]GGB14509.1 hypothetical protein GCM10010979_31320 [Conyzicola nivalis]
MTAIRIWRIGLIATGLAFFVVGGITLLEDVSPARYLGIGIWLLGALVIHDGIISLAVFGANVVTRKTAGRFRVPLPAVLILQGALVIAGIMTLIVVPAALKKSAGTGNETLLPLDYGLHLVVFYVALAVVTALALGVYALVRRRRPVAG